MTVDERELENELARFQESVAVRLIVEVARRGEHRLVVRMMKCTL